VTIDTIILQAQGKCILNEERIEIKMLFMEVDREMCMLFGAY
jgi:hypothetical protein